MRKLHGHLRAVREAAADATMPAVREAEMRPHADDLDAELDEAAQVGARTVGPRWACWQNLTVQ